jgi:hypothetical protein
VPAYRVYIIGRDGHVAGPAPVADCQDDREAVEKAEQYLDGRSIEVWDGARLVAHLHLTHANPAGSEHE